MGRPIRLTVPGLPHHVTHRGNRRQRTFFEERDHKLYIRYLAEACTAIRSDAISTLHRA